VDQAFDELLRRARRRDPEALARVVEVYSPRVFGLLYRLTGSRDAAEELLQETFLRVVRVIGDYEHSGRFEAWLFRIAANLARDRARQRGRRAGNDLREAVVESTILPRMADERSVDPAEHALRQEAGERVARCLARLSPADREILVLRHYSDLSFREIAALLDVPLGTALARAHRAVQHLRGLLAGEEGA
jgi:RNA polymerase sigma-70 factor, ECF subfamily